MRELREEHMTEVITLRPYDNVEQQQSPEVVPIREVGSIALLQARKKEFPKSTEPDLSALDTAGMYMNRIAKVPLLKHEEEVDLMKRYSAGEEAGELLAVGDLDDEKKLQLQTIEQMGNDAKTLMVESNLRLVVSVAKQGKYQNRGLDLLDIIQEGNKGLVRAVEKYSYNKGYKFTTYATWWISQSIQRGLINGGQTVRIPMHAEAERYKVRKTEMSLSEATGREPSIEEVANHSGIKVDKIRELNQTRSVVSMHQPVGEEGNSLEDFIEDKNSNFTHEVERDMLLETVHSAISELNEKEQDVIRKRFGLDGSHPQTLDGIGQEHGLTRERIRQIESSVKRKLRNNAELHEVYKDLIK